MQHHKAIGNCPNIRTRFAVSLKDFYTYSDVLTRMIIGRRSENFKGSPEILRVDLRHGFAGFSFEV